MSGRILGETLQRLLKGAFDDAQARVSHEIAHRAARYKRKVMKDLLSLTVISLSILFLAVAFTFLFIEYLVLNVTISFLITGILLLFIGLIIKVMR